MRKIALAMLGLSGIALGACGTTTPAPEQAMADSECPVIQSENWTAQLMPLPGGEGRYQLVVTGNVTMPTPGFTFAWEQGRLDRSAIPAFELRLLTNAPAGTVAQMLETREVIYAGPAAAARYRSVTITCDGRTLGTVENIG